MNNLEIDSIVENVKSSLSKVNNNKLVDVTNSFLYTTLRRLLDFIQNPDKDALELSLKNVHYEGVISIPIKIGILEMDKEKRKHLRRFFISLKEIPPFAVQLHSHKYNLNIIPIHGNIMHHRAYSKTFLRGTSDKEVYLDRFEYSSGINGEGGQIKYDDTLRYEIESSHLPIGSFNKLEYNDIHTMSCDAGSIWFVEETQYISNTSYFLGVPFSTNNYYEKLKSEEVLEYLTLIENKILNILENYK